MIGLVLRKELLELRRSPVLLLSMASLPATVVAVPVALLAWLVHAAPEQALAFAQDVYGLHERDPALGVAAVLARNWLPMFLVLPIFLPILLAAQSIGGERERRTLEPLLATPVSTLSIILGKSHAEKNQDDRGQGQDLHFHGHYLQSELVTVSPSFSSAEHLISRLQKADYHGVSPSSTANSRLTWWRDTT